MFDQPKIAPSILSADFARLGESVELVEAAGADWIHVDIMDGHFVPNMTMGPGHVKALRDVTRLPLDVHLMVDNPEEQVPWFLEAGADIVTIHHEVFADKPELLKVETIKKIHDAGAMAGIAINPDTDPSVLMGILPLVEMVLVMSVFPGFGGQSFIEETPQRLLKTAEVCRSRMRDPFVEVDGGINAQTAAQCVKYGADVLVAGNAIFGAPDPAAALKEIRDAY